MFDTVRFVCFLLLVPSPRDLAMRDGWRLTQFTSKDPRPWDAIFANSILGIRLFVANDRVVRQVEVDLPKVLFGHNGRLIDSDQMLQNALAALKTVLKSICNPCGVKSGYFPGDYAGDWITQYTRVDLVWQFDVQPSLLFLAMRHAKHPCINRQNGHYDDETLVFPGTNLRISMYDKKRKMRARCEHNAARVEIQLSGSVLEKRLGNAQGRVEELDFNLAWQTYRQILTEFPSVPVPAPNGKGTIVEFLAHLEATTSGSDHVDNYILIRGLCPRKARALRREVGKCMPRLVNFSLADLLPESGPPPSVVVPAPKSEDQARKYYDKCKA